MEFRRFREEDYDAVCDFFIAINRGGTQHINWNWGRFEWMYGHPDFDSSLLNSIGLWWDGGELVGAAVYDMYFGEAFCGVLPGRDALYPEILAYAWAELRDEAGLGIAICDGNSREIEAAKAQGFVPVEQSETVMQRRLDAPLPVRMPDGLSCQTLDPAQDSAEEIGWLFWRGFDHGEDRAAFEEDFRKTQSAGGKIRKHFNPALSVAAADPSGEKVACCCLWYQKQTDYAYVEPVCTVPAWRGKGAARAVVSEALNRARSLGAKKAYVISDMAFYEKLGFKKERHFTFYWKK